MSRFAGLSEDSLESTHVHVKPVALVLRAKKDSKSRKFTIRIPQNKSPDAQPLKKESTCNPASESVVNSGTNEEMRNAEDDSIYKNSDADLINEKSMQSPNTEPNNEIQPSEKEGTESKAEKELSHRSGSFHSSLSPSPHREEKKNDISENDTNASFIRDVSPSVAEQNESDERSLSPELSSTFHTFAAPRSTTRITETSTENILETFKDAEFPAKNKRKSSSGRGRGRGRGQGRGRGRGRGGASSRDASIDLSQSSSAMGFRERESNADGSSSRSSSQATRRSGKFVITKMFN